MAKSGRKSKRDNLDETQGVGSEIDPDPRVRRFLGKRAVQYSVTERIREKIDPDLIINYWVMVLQGHVPVWIPDNRAKGGYRIEPDPSPIIGTSTPAQRDAAIRELNNRGWGLPVQSLQIDTHMKMQLEAGTFPEHMLKDADMKLLAEMQKLFQNRMQLTDVTDAELVEDPADPPGNDPAIANSVPISETIANTMPELDSINESTNENSPPEDDSSEL